MVMTQELITDYDIRGTNATGLTIECAWNIGKATAEWLPTAGSVVVAYVPTQATLANAVIEGIRLQGRNVVDAGGGDKNAAISYIQTAGLSGAVVVSADQVSNVVTIELYQEDGKRIEASSGLKEVYELVQAGNFVPAAVKGEVTAIA
jgi:phosphomannomutase